MSREVPDQVRVLVVSPHRDDEAIGCGGTISLHADRGDLVHVVHLSGLGGASLAEAREAGRRLGVAGISTLSAPETQLTADRALLTELVAVFREFRPGIVYAPHADEDDPAHRVAAELAREARWISAYPILPEAGPALEEPPAVVYEFEVWTPIARPSVFVDITAVRDRKAGALAAYASQLAHNEWIDGALGLNRYRGVTSGHGEFVEAFSVLRTDHSRF
ncbi:PIG-L deacetylase family protein [Actinomadura litoris]|uniref:PIG-L deacetylase family protein n=1 Tax=Actinomadura litoris TaxID=2678616 RepID=UPI001FA7283D|nr:PIG-L deacetylase family protein [Actinomadura litoris]